MLAQHFAVGTHLNGLVVDDDAIKIEEDSFDHPVEFLIFDS
jgi:hypothetical protein